MLAVRSANTEPIPGYRLLEPLGKGGFGEVWKCQAPGGMLKAVKFVEGNDELDQGESNAEQELRALENIKGLRHPFLLSIERVEIVEGNLVIVSELADRSLHDLLETHRAAGRPGIPRAEALAYLFEAAEVLDFLNHEHGLQHLDIKPRNLLLVGRHIKVGDFGLVASLSEVGTRSDALAGITPLYASPEIFDGHPSPYSDQYSLAVSYMELLTGETPYKARNSRQLMMMIATLEPDLSKLIEGDRAVVARAMSKAPAGRFSSCTEFVDALARVSPPTTSGVYRARTTALEVPVGSLGATKSNPRPSSGLFSRESRMVSAIRPAAPQGEQVLPGYHLQESLGRGPTGELWRARGPQGTPKFVRLMTPPGLNERGENPLDLLSRIDHPIAPRWEVVPAGSERVALVCDAGDSSLGNRFKEFRTAGHPGIPRVELMGTLGAIAQGLDELYHDTGLQHLCLTPKHLALQHGGALLLEFGLAELLWLPAGVQPATMNPRYSSGELHEGLISDACDQYSLALIYAELLVGVHPFRNLNARQLASSQLRGQPDLSLLPGVDRSIVAKALHADAQQRFRSCSEFLLALEAGVQQASHGTVAVPTSTAATRQGVSVMIPSLAQAAAQAAAPTSAGSQPWRSGIDEIVAGAAKGFEIQNVGLIHYRSQRGAGMEHRSWVRIAPGMARLKMSGFQEQWQAKLAGEAPSRWRFVLERGASLWERCRGKVPGLCVDVTMGTPQSSNGDLTPVLIAIAPVDCAPGKAAQLLAELGPALLTSLQAYLSIQSRREDQERFPLQEVISWQTPFGGMPVTAQTRDIGRKGMAIYSTQPIPLSAGTISLSRPASTATLQVPAVVRDCVPDGEGRYLVEIAFGG
jgi:serine/threonine protein kinase